MKRYWRFYTAVVLVQLFSAFPCRNSVPVGIMHRQAHLNGTDRSQLDLRWNESALVVVSMEDLPLSSAWYYVPTPIAARTEGKFNQSLARYPDNSAACVNSEKGGYRLPQGWEVSWPLAADVRLLVAEIGAATKVIGVYRGRTKGLDAPDEQGKNGTAADTPTIKVSSSWQVLEGHSD